jgi:uncharacterized protein YodC (DUF2158 family)
MSEAKPGDVVRLKSGGEANGLKTAEVTRPKSGGDTCTVKPGDVVRLKSGGPRMTVNSPPDNERKVQCRWFGKGVNEDRTLFEFFVVDTLEPEKRDQPVAIPAEPAAPAPAATVSQTPTEVLIVAKPVPEEKPGQDAKKGPGQDRPLSFD